VERPSLSALTDLVGELSRTVSRLDDLQQRVIEVTGTAWSPDGLVKAVVGPRGHLLDLELDPRIYRTPNSKALAATIQATIRAAVEQANDKAQEIIDEYVPPDLREAKFGRFDLQTLNRTHDADLLPREPRDG
jgi:DNA-binding protein YbaB